MTDTATEDAAINWRYELNGVDVTEQLLRVQAVEAELREVMAHEVAMAVERDAARNEAIRAMREARLSQRVIGDVLGISHQRVHQLTRRGVDG